MTLSNNRDLSLLVSQAISAFNALSPEEQRAHRREQAIDWAYGQMLFKYNGHPPLTKEKIAEIYDARQV